LLQHQIVLADGFSWHVLVKGVLPPTNSLSLPTRLNDIDFPFNLLSISQLTKSLQSEISGQLGKHLRSSFPISSHSRQSESFDVVHTENMESFPHFYFEWISLFCSFY
jgi:hypothetical protein